MKFDRTRPVGKRLKEDFEDFYDDDISIDFIDDSPKSTIKQSTNDKLNIIFKKLEVIETYLKQLVGNNQPITEGMASIDRLPRGAQEILDTPFAEPQIPNMNNYFTSNVNQANLYAPQNVRPQGSMLEEIQQVLTQQDVIEAQPGQNVVNTVCSSNIGYDDNIEGIDIDNIKL